MINRLALAQIHSEYGRFLFYFILFQVKNMLLKLHLDLTTCALLFSKGVLLFAWYYDVSVYHSIKNIILECSGVDFSFACFYSCPLSSQFVGDDAESQKFLTNGFLGKKMLDNYADEYVSLFLALEWWDSHCRHAASLMNTFSLLSSNRIQEIFHVGCRHLT